MARQKYTKPAEIKQEAKTNPLILTQAEHAKLSDKEKEDFRANNGTVSNR